MVMKAHDVSGRALPGPGRGPAGPDLRGPGSSRCPAGWAARGAFRGRPCRVPYLCKAEKRLLGLSSRGPWGSTVPLSLTQCK